MKHTYSLLLGALLSLAALPGWAQYQFKDAADASSAGLAPYAQNFDLPAATTTVAFNSDGSSTNYPGVYARFTVDGDANQGEYVAGFNFTPTPNSIPASDGTNPATAWYHFGASGSTERAFGGIGGKVVAAGQTYPSGVGYIGVRLKNSSTSTIKNLSVKYAMEQWYNSSRTQAATTQVHYRRTVRSGTAPTYTYTPASITTLIGSGWTEIPALMIEAPSTTVPIEERNGNSATNRRVAQTTLSGINLLPGEEIMLRFNYVFNEGSNGNGLSIDDLVVTPETNVFYSLTSGNLDDTNTWGIATNGTGTHPANFTAANQTFYVLGADATTNRVQQGNGWVVSGANSKIIVGIPASPAIGSTVAKAAVTGALYVASSNKTVTAPIDVAEGSTLRIDDVNSAVTLGMLATTSTVEYNNATGTHTIKPASYGNLKLSGVGAKALGSDIIINGTLDLNNQAKLTLGNYDATLLRPSTNVGTYGGSVLNAGTTAYVVTSGTGQLRQSVPNSGVNIVFPVGTAGSYTPVKLKQSASTSEDVYGVRVINEAYVKYDAAEAGVGTAVAYQNVKKTWLIEEEVAGSSNITMALQWNKTDATTDFVPAKAHINHYVGGASGGWDNYPTTLDFTTVATDVYSVARAGITSFSPFAVSSRVGGVLPVELTAFDAQRTAAGVLSSWSTASEENNDHFILERSLDGKTFRALSTVPGHGTSSQPHQYHFLDAQPAFGVVYYRLQQVDFDGRVVYSPVVAVAACSSCVQPAAISIAPNPGAGRFELWTNFAEAAAVPATVLTTLGTPVVTRTLSIGAGAQRTELDLSTQPAGVYLVRLAAPGGPIMLRVTKY